MGEKIKVGVIGTGPRGRYLFSVLIANPDVEAYAICDSDPKALSECEKMLKEKNVEGVCSFSSVEEFLASDVEAVLVVTHVSSHADISVECLNAGKHVLCEIPNIANDDDAKKLYRAVKANPDKKFMVAENCCFWAFVETWKKMYKDGLLGDVVFAEADYLHNHLEIEPEGRITWRSYMTSINYLTHDLGPLLYILDDTCDEIYGFTPNINPIEDVHPAPSDGVAMIKTKKGALIKIYVGFGVHHESGHGYTMYGSKGSLQIQTDKGYKNNNTFAQLSSVPNTKEAIEIPVSVGYPNASHEGHGGADPKMMEAFVNCIKNDTKPPLDIEFGINIALPGIYAEYSAKNGGKMIKMPDISEFE